jgi:hypothetical protein
MQASVIHINSQRSQHFQKLQKFYHPYKRNIPATHRGLTEILWKFLTNFTGAPCAPQKPPVRRLFDTPIFSKPLPAYLWLLMTRRVVWDPVTWEAKCIIFISVDSTLSARICGSVLFRNCRTSVWRWESSESDSPMLALFPLLLSLGMQTENLLTNFPLSSLMSFL